MHSETKIVISASRRTDIPAFYMPWFMDRIEKGRFELSNPYHRRLTTVEATPDKVHTIVFWSKNFGPFIKQQFGKQLQKKGYHLFFNFTINSELPLLEPRMPPLQKRLDQLRYLCEHFGPDTVSWRFDPICFFKTADGRTQNNLHDFLQIADNAAGWGVIRCITSFMDDYPKIQKRIASMPGFAFLDPVLGEKKQIVLGMEKTLLSRNMRLYTCCEKELLEALPADSTIAKSACIPNDLLLDLFGGNLSLRQDKGQRVKAGCGCKVSVDIGSYRSQPCYHNCLFCYANPVSGQPFYD
jgi:hypothetical protein